MDNTAKQAAGGLMWSAIERFATQGVQFLLNIIIARVLLPSDYGLIVMLSIFMAIAQTFVDSGFGNALIQKNNRTQTDYSTVFYTNIAISIVCYAILYFSAPAIAAFYKEPQLVSIARWLGLTLPLSALSIVQRAKLTIEMNFKTQAKASLASVVVGGFLGFALAYYGYGVWAIVAQNITSTLLGSLLLWVYAHWRPSLIFSGDSFRSLFAFGSKLLLSGLLHTIYVNMYSLVIGKFYKASQAGLYNRAYSLAQFPSSNITSIITRVVYPLQCKIQDDPVKLKASFEQYIRLSAFIVFPLMALLAVLARPLIETVLTDNWLQAADLLSILCVAYMIYPILVLNNNVLNVRGRSDYFLKAEVIKKILSVAILVATIPFGVKMLCWGLALYNVLDFIIIVQFSKRVVMTGYILQLKAIAPIFLLSCSMAGVAYLCVLLFDSAILQLIVGAVVATLFFAAMGLAFKIREIIFAAQWIKLKIRKQ